MEGGIDGSVGFSIRKESTVRPDESSTDPKRTVKDKVPEEASQDPEPAEVQFAVAGH